MGEVEVLYHTLPIGIWNLASLIFYESVHAGVAAGIMPSIFLWQYVM